MMLGLELTLLTLLIAAPGLLVFGDTVITCDGDVHRLSCDSGVIQVTSTVYGRSDGNICPSLNPSLTVTDTSCSSGAITSIADRCDGLSVCEINTRFLGTADPCAGTYKYYTTTYDCIEGYTAVVCKHGYRTLDCGSDNIEIINAFFGRTDSTTCSQGIAPGLTKNTNCFDPSVLSALETQCNGQTTCTVEAFTTNLQGSCKATAGYLTVSYKCAVA